VFAGAIAYHRRAGDYANPKTRGPAMAPAVLGLVSVATVAALSLTA
jgi:hypothetical protein